MFDAEDTIMNTSARDSVLYFPSMEFQSQGWLKAALLIWDRVYRIVPANYVPKESYVIKQAADHGLIRAVTLEEKDLSVAHDDFLNLCESMEYTPAGLGGGDERIHREKIDSRLYPILEKMARDYDGDWFHLSREMVRGYMLFLSQVVAERRQLVRATDNPDAWVVSTFLAEDGNISEFVYGGEEGPVNLYDLAVPDLIPLSIERVPMDEIIAFVEKRKDEKRVFREVLTNFAERLSECDSEDHARVLMNDFKDSMLKAKQDLRNSMDFCDRDQLSSIFAVGLPAALTAIGTIAALKGVPGVNEFLTSFLVGSIASYADHTRVTRSKRPKHLSAYLLDLDEKLAKEKAFPNLRASMEEFIND